jgi:ClpP class serine protease
MGELANLTLGQLFSSNISLFNSEGKIPLEVTSVTATDPTQFWITLILAGISSFFILMVAWNNMLKPIIGEHLLRFSLRKMKRQTGRPILFIKHTSQDMFNQSMINQQTMLALNRAMNDFKGKPFDLVLHTPGGEIFSSLMISRMLRNYPGEIRVFVPLYAMSGGTLLALSGSKIFMNKISCLGPVDPQLGNLFKFGSARGWKQIMDKKGNKAEDSTISFALMGQQYTKSIHDHILKLLENKMKDADRRRFAKFLTDGNVEHAYPLTPEELKRFNFDVQSIEPSISKRLEKVVGSAWYEGVYHI